MLEARSQNEAIDSQEEMIGVSSQFSSLGLRTDERAGDVPHNSPDHDYGDMRRFSKFLRDA